MDDIDPDDLERVKSRLKKCVESCAETVSEKRTEVPQRTIFIGDSTPPHKKEVPLPSRYTITPDLKQKFFADTAEWLYASEFVPTNTGSQGGEHSELAQKVRYQAQLMNLTIATLRYSGGYDVTNDAFDAAFEDHWLRYYRDRLKYRLVVPLRFMAGFEGKLSLSPVEIITDDPSNHQIESLYIQSLESSEFWNSILTYEEGEFPGVVHHINDDHAVLVGDIIATDVPNEPIHIGSKVAGKVVDALRLFKPTNDVVFMGPTYLIEPGWLEFREGVPTITAANNPPVGTPERAMSLYDEFVYELAPDEFSEFNTFWNRFGGYLSEAIPDDLSSSLRRFNEMYSKPYVEDRIVDCAIALEGTVLAGISQKSSFTFRLALRSSLLLDQFVPFTRESIKKVAKNIYHARSQIVHQDESLEEVVNNDGFESYQLSSPPNPSHQTQGREKEITDCDFFLHSRYFLAQVILAYLQHRIELKEGNSCHETNKRLDSAVWKSQYSLEMDQ